MTNPNDRYHRSDYPNAPVNPNEPNPTQRDAQNYRSGYVDAETDQQMREVRENNTSNGVLIGILLAGLIVAGVGTAVYLAQRDRTPTIERTNTTPSLTPSPSPSPQVRERVIERDRVVPVPQQPAPAPNITITAPRPQQQSPVSQPSPVTPPTSTQTNPSESTPPTNSTEPSGQPNSSGTDTTSPSPSPSPAQ